MAALLNPNGSLNLNFIRSSPLSDRFGLVASGFNHLLAQSSRLNYSLSCDSNWIFYLLDIQEKPLAWLGDSVELLYNLVIFIYGYQIPDTQAVRYGATQQQHHTTLYNIVREGTVLVQEFKAHQRSFTDFITSTADGQWNLANVRTLLREDHGLRLSSSYRRRVGENMDLYSRVREYQRRLDRVEVEFSPTPFSAVRVPQNLIKLDKFYGPPGVEQFRYPGIPPGRRFTLNILLEHKFDLTRDIHELGATPSYVTIYYST